VKKKFYRPLLYWLLISAQKIFMFLPYRWGFSFGGTMGRLAFYALPKEREKTLSHLRFAFGNEKTEREYYEIAKQVFDHYGKTAAELCLIDKLIKHFDDYVTTSGYENLDRGLAGGRGIIIATAHFGNWEIMGGYSALKGYPLTVIARKIYFEKYDKLLVGTREKMKVKVIYRDESVKSMLGVLRHNGILGFLVDQDIDSIEGVFVNFFNKHAYTAVAPVRFALASGAPLVPAFVIREGMRHHIIVEPPIELTVTGDKEEDIRVNTQKWVAIQEKYIRRYPHMWVWNHRRWKTSPTLATDEKVFVN